MRVLNFGSLNIDMVFAVDHIVRPGETIASTGLQVHAGGKGANQSVALARAGAQVFHAGRIGADGLWLRDKLRAQGVDVSHIITGAEPTGQAIIQVDARGQNSIVLLGGGNQALTRPDIDATLQAFGPGDVLLLQNEVNEVAYLMQQGQARGLTICFNPAPFGPNVNSYPLTCVDLLVVNETEGAGLSGRGEPDTMLAQLGHLLPQAEVLLTLGERGAIHQHAGKQTRQAAPTVRAVDTTAAGDTFIGYYLAGRGQGMNVQAALAQACAAAAICVTRPGAMDSIPTRAEVEHAVREVRVGLSPHR